VSAGKLFMLILVFNAFCASSAPAGEAPGWNPRIGMLLPGGPQYHTVEAFRQGLRDLGYVEGQNVVIDVRYAEWNLDRLPGLAEELVRLKPDVIFTHTTPGVLALRQVTKTIPIVVGAAGGLVERGVVASLARPGGNITGLTLIDTELEPKRLQILKEAAPKVSRVAVLVNPANPAWNQYPESFAPAARNLGLRLQRVEARDPPGVTAALSTAAKDRFDALLMVTDAIFSTNQKRIVELAGQRRLPSISGRPGFAADGGLLQHGPSIPDMSRRAATYVDRILKGAKPADLPVEQPTKFDLVINLKTAKALGLTIPQSVLLRADEVIR
jgi:putative ABC transport system substrate-binding protein